MGQTRRGENLLNEIKKLKKMIIASFAICILLEIVFAITICFIFFFR